LTVDLTDDERQALINLLTVEIEASKFPLSPRIEQLKRIRAKLAARHSRRRRQRGRSGVVSQFEIVTAAGVLIRKPRHMIAHLF
jgi:hypothetical protein